MSATPGGGSAGDAGGAGASVEPNGKLNSLQDALRQLRALRRATVGVLRALRRRDALRAAASVQGAAPAQLAELMECERELEEQLLPAWASFVPSMPFVYGGQAFPQQLKADRQKLIAGLCGVSAGN